MQFNTLDVIKTPDNYHYIEWSLTLTGGEVSDDFKFQIEYSNDPATGFTPIEFPPGTVVEIDGANALVYTHNRRHFDFNKDYYYRVISIEKATPTNTVTSIVVFIGNDFDGVHDTIRYGEEILYGCYTGEPCKILKKKTNGARCSSCWSPTRRQRTKTRCSNCNGTGFEEGYYDAIDVQISFDSDPVKADSQKDMENKLDTKRARLSNYPIVRDKDIIINMDDNKRYVITHVETTKLPKLSTGSTSLSKQNYILSQLLTLEDLITTDNEYNIGLDQLIVQTGTAPDTYTNTGTAPNNIVGG